MVSNKKIVTLVLITVVGLAFTGCSDNETASVVAPVVIDTAPPAVPAEVDAYFSGDSAVITWAQNSVDSDLAGFIVVRDRYGVSSDLVASPAMINSYIDHNPLAGVTTYHVYSVDTSGNQSAVSSTSLTRSVDDESRGELVN